MSKFFARPRLDDNQFRQLSGDTLNLSGTTNFDGTLKSKNVEINASLDNATGGTITSKYVLTLDVDNIIKLKPNEGGGADVSFDSNRYTTRSGIPSVYVGGNTLGQFLEGYFFPSVPPDALISIATGGSSRQFGDGTLGNLAWTATRNTNPLTQIQLDTTGSAVYNLNVAIIDGNTQSGTAAYGLTLSDYIPVTGTTQKTRTYLLKVTAGSEIANASAAISWRHKRFWFKSSTVYTSSDALTIQALLNGGSPSSELTTSKSKTFSPITFNNEYFYYVYPMFFGVPAFTVNGLPNNAWGNLSTDTLFVISYTNTNGYTERFYVAKSDQSMSNTFNIISA